MNKIVTFDEETVNEWKNCHNVTYGGEEIFGEETVPGFMLVDELAGVVNSLADENEDMVVSGITAVRFRDPVLIGEDVKYSVSVMNETPNYTELDFSCRAVERDSLAVLGSVQVIIK